jgi:hypothetical protein
MSQNQKEIKILSHVSVIIDGVAVWIGKWIDWTLTAHTFE